MIIQYGNHFKIKKKKKRKERNVQPWKEKRKPFHKYSRHQDLQRGFLFLCRVLVLLWVASSPDSLFIQNCVKNTLVSWEIESEDYTSSRATDDEAAKVGRGSRDLNDNPAECRPNNEGDEYIYGHKPSSPKTIINDNHSKSISWWRWRWRWDKKISYSQLNDAFVCYGLCEVGADKSWIEHIKYDLYK